MSHTTHKVDILIDIDKLKENPLSHEVLHILNLIRPEWQSDRIRAKEFTGGISNHIYGYYEDAKFNEDVVLFRIDAEGKDLMVDKDREIENMQALHAADCGPPLDAIFSNGIAYGYIHGETLNHNTVIDETVRKLVIKEMCRVHEIKPEKQSPNPDGWRQFLYRLWELSPDGFPTDLEKHKRYEELIKPKHKLREELDELWCHVEALKSPVVFCHNDTQPFNIIYNKDKGSVHFIDYEFAMYNYEHYDLGSHFCEYLGTDTDVSRYPDKLYQLDWIRYYLQCKAELRGGCTEDVTEKDVEDCYVRTNKFALVSHFICGLWGLVQARFSKIEFDFLEYASIRLGEYFKRKEEFFALKVPK